MVSTSCLPFFFQAEDGIRDHCVTGVQTCALPISSAFPEPRDKVLVLVHGLCMNDRQWNRGGHDHGAALARDLGYALEIGKRRVGKECRCRWEPDHRKKKGSREEKRKRKRATGRRA